MGNIKELQSVEIAKIKPYKNNAKIHGKNQLKKLQESISEFGFLTPCLIDQEYNLIAGHGRVEAAKALGMKEVPCVFVENLNSTQRRAYILADNRLGELGEWDMDLVSQELQTLSDSGFNLELTGFTFDDITSDDIDFSELDEEAEKIKEELPEESSIQQGQMFRLGNHILLCGDSTKDDDLKRLMGKELADLVVTDPPYNVDVTGETKENLKIMNDSMDDDSFVEFLSAAFKNLTNGLKLGGGWYIWLASSTYPQFEKALSNNGMHERQQLIWVKNQFLLGRSDYQWRHEPCLYGWKDGAAHYFIDDRTKSSVFEKIENIDEISEEEAKKLLKRFFNQNQTMTSIIHEKKPLRNEDHPTMKPVALIERLIENSSKSGDIVLDLFGGSGTTLIACENKHRKCRMMELDPHYCEVIIKRWEKLTGEKAELIN